MEKDRIEPARVVIKRVANKEDDEKKGIEHARIRLVPKDNGK